MDITTILCAIVIVQALVLALIFAVVVRLRARVEQVGNAATAAIGQMGQLVHEAHALSQIMAKQVEEHIRLREMGPPSIPVAMSRLVEAQEDDEEELPATRPARRPAAKQPAGRPPALPRMRLRQTAAVAREETQPDQGNVDRDVARQNGMDPLGVALQRSLARQRARVKVS